jgi:DNA polymerase III delta prime subunit
MSDRMIAWMQAEWLPLHPDFDLKIVWSTQHAADDLVISKLNRQQSFAGYRFIAYERVECPVIEVVETRNHKGETTQQTGAYLLHFVSESDASRVQVLVGCAHYQENPWYLTAVAAVPAALRMMWTAFEHECDRLAYAIEPENRVVIVGGRHDSFVPTVGWDEIVLPADLKQDILDDVRSFLTKGVQVYRRLNLKPFRKLLLAGVPGTGKTMLCNALAKWALEQGYLVIYVSSAKKKQDEAYGSSFGKIQHALDIAAASECPAIILLEELDAYLHDEEKALILNVLDGSESAINPHGTLLIATTNYPEAIDERVLKRPGRLDRIVIVPQTRTQTDASTMLRRYLGVMWQDAHEAVVPLLVGYPGAFIREVAIYALTQVAYDDLETLSPEVLEQSFYRLKAQIEARDDFLKSRDQENAEGVQPEALEAEAV